MKVSPIDILDHTTSNYAAARVLLEHRVEACRREQDAVVKRHLQGIREAASLAAQAEAQLRGHIESYPELFVKPRTMTLHGVKVGFQKGKGRIEYSDEAKVIELIRKHLPDEADTLIVVTEAPLKTALLNLDAKQLAKLGCTITGTEDTVLIKDSAGEVDKIVNRLIADYSEPGDGDTH